MVARCAAALSAMVKKNRRKTAMAAAFTRQTLSLASQNPIRLSKIEVRI
jgi:hypothetical protein